MTSTRSRLVILKGVSSPLDDELEALREHFDIVEVENVEQARQYVEDAGDMRALVLLDAVPESVDLPAPRGASQILQHIGEGIGVVNRAGELVWANSKLKSQDEEILQQFTDLCRHTLEWLNQRQADDNGSPDLKRVRQKFSFGSDRAWYEAIISPAVTKDDHPDAEVNTVVGVLWDVTESKRLQNRIDAIDAAGSELMKIQSAEIARMNMAERLKWFEERIVRYIHDLLHFDNFEIRLLNKETNQLELVIAVGLTPLKIGEVIYAEREGNGISGYVATTGESYICPDVREDPLYREGMDNACSSLTVPLFLHDQVIGVLNAESYTPNVFDETDRRFAEIFGRYIAIAMNILDLMVVERYTTNEQVAANVLQELDEPLGEITDHTEHLHTLVGDNKQAREEIEKLLEATAAVRDRIAACTAGPRTILGAEQELRKHEIDPLMKGKRILVADDEPRIRDTISTILKQKGCDVTVCASGEDTINSLQNQRAPYDLIISDIRMPNCNGYEVFRSAKEANDSTPVILMTGFGYDPHHSIVRSSQEGLDSFLFKPFKASQLVEAVSKALQDRG